MARVLGIDPGLRITGYGLVELKHPGSTPALIEAGVIRLKTTAVPENRLQQLHRDLIELIEELRPDRMAIEKLYAHYNHPRTAILMAHARGVILLGATQKNLPIEHLPANVVKKAVTGYGHASKRQMQLAVQAEFRLPTPPAPPDVADAIAIALTCAQRLK
jgi:crossover junction endodeoxyribonuclease RuvC